MRAQRLGVLVGVLFAGLSATDLVVAGGKIVTERVPETPVFAGDSVLWTERTRGGAVELWSDGPSGERALLQRLVPEEPDTELLFKPAASGALVAGSLFAFQYLGPRAGTARTYSRIYAGERAGPMAPVVECQRGRYFEERAIDVWERAYVYWTCDEELGHVEIRDLGAEPLSPSRAVGVGGNFARIAGRFVAWLDGTYYSGIDENRTDIVVYDRVADAEVYRLTPSEVPGRVHSLDIQEDGKVAVSFVDPDRRAGTRGSVVGWASPQEPRLHEVPLPVEGEYMVRMAGDRVAFQGGHPQDFSIQNAYVGVADLGGGVRLAARATDTLAATTTESFDYDGRRLVWREFGCEERRLRIRSIDEPGIAPGGTRRCRLRFEKRPRIDKGTLVMDLGCGAFPPPCEFVVSARIAHSGRLAARARFPRRNPVRMRLTRRARLELARRGRLRVDVRAVLLPARSLEQVRRAQTVLRSR
jgi:hypothetical protein